MPNEQKRWGAAPTALAAVGIAVITEGFLAFLFWFIAGMAAMAFLSTFGTSTWVRACRQRWREFRTKGYSPEPNRDKPPYRATCRVWDGQAVFRLERLNFDTRPYYVEPRVKDERLDDWVGLREGAPVEDNEWGYEARYPADFQHAPKDLAAGRYEVVWRQARISALGPTSNYVELASWAGSYRDGSFKPK